MKRVRVEKWVSNPLGRGFIRLNALLAGIFVFSSPIKVLAEGTDALGGRSVGGGSASDAQGQVDAVLNDSLTRGGSTTQSTVDNSSNLLDTVREYAPKGHENGVKEINQMRDILDGARDSSYSDAVGAASPFLYYISWFTTFLYVIGFGLFTLSTVVDILGLTSSLCRALFSGNRGSSWNPFQLSWDAEQILNLHGLGQQSQGSNNQQGQQNNRMGGMNSGVQVVQNQTNNNSNQQASRGNLLSAYVRKRAWSLVLLFFAWGFFGSSVAFGFSGNVASYLINIVNGFSDWISGV